MNNESMKYQMEENNEMIIDNKNENIMFYDNLIREKYVNYYLNYTKATDSSVHCTYVCKNFLKPSYKHLPFLKSIFRELLKRDESSIAEEKIPYDVKRLLYYQSVNKDYKKEIINDNGGSGSDSESYEETYEDITDDDNMSIDLQKNIKKEYDNKDFVMKKLKKNFKTRYIRIGLKLMLKNKSKVYITKSKGFTRCDMNLKKCAYRIKKNPNIKNDLDIQYLGEYENKNNNINITLECNTPGKKGGFIIYNIIIIDPENGEIEISLPFSTISYKQFLKRNDKSFIAKIKNLKFWR
ncbi:hypothetical protein PIROE2DRAFT_59517 [Piromyces sp. E2]|nr:hypothetical protein PIROE2DRAFT_59517 [Piromyces sp. E2]|eukprot:OUM66196.1 hypothetical protein PIROE2DRAFT_59517 [Piromyces sp. E2]